MRTVSPAHIKSTTENHFQLQADSPAPMAATNDGYTHVVQDSAANWACAQVKADGSNQYDQDCSANRRILNNGINDTLHRFKKATTAGSETSSSEKFWTC